MTAINEIKINETSVNMVWKCEQWFAGQMQERKMFFTEGQAREFASKLNGVAPDLVLRIEAMPIQNVWN